MPIITIVLGGLLIVIGVASRLVSDSPSATVLIPAWLGAGLAVLGIVAAARPAARMHVMHAAVLIALAGIIGGAGAVVHLPALFSGGPVERPLAVAARSLTAALCLVYLVLAIRSFVAARLARRPAA